MKLFPGISIITNFIFRPQPVSSQKLSPPLPHTNKITHLLQETPELQTLALNSVKTLPQERISN